jgi:glycosyltransferase involved in cell wall biosynthesis
MTDVLFFVGSLAVGGTEKHLSQVLPALAKRGWALKAVLFKGGGAFAEPIEAAGIPIEVLPRGFSVSVPKLRGALALMQQTRALAVGLRRRPPRILHCFLPTCCIVGGLAARMAGFSPVVMSRRSQAARPSSFLGDKSMEGWALRHANLVFGHSSRVIDELKAEGIPSARLRLNHNGIDLEAFDGSAGEREETRRAEKWDPDEIVIATVANLIPYKGHVDLLQAFARLADNLPPWRLVLVGQGGTAFTQELRGLSQRLGLAERVDFLGGRADVPRLLKAADAGILASHQEGFPNAILEYMAASLPVIATATGGNLDAVCDDQTGLLIPPAAPELLAQAVTSLLSDPPLRKRLGQAGRRRVESTFSLDACVDRYEDAYRGLLGKGHHHG